MVLRNTLIVGFFAIGLFSCSENTESIEKENKELPSETESVKSEEEDPIAETDAPKVIAFDSKSVFTITTNRNDDDSDFGTEEFDIFLNNEQFDAPLLLTSDINYSEVDPKNYDDIPENTAFAFSTWFAGGGAVYYGIVKKGVLKVYRKYEDEMMSSPDNFDLYREFDPIVKTDLPAYFIQYSPDDKRGADIMIACSSNGKGLYAKYKGQTRHIEMKFTKDESEGRNIIQYFDEIVNGEVNGTYKMTHSGNYDYLEYTNKESGRVYPFTINFDETISNDTYRTTPSF